MKSKFCPNRSPAAELNGSLPTHALPEHDGASVEVDEDNPSAIVVPKRRAHLQRLETELDELIQQALEQLRKSE